MIGWPAGPAEVGGGGLSRLNLIVVYLTAPFAKTNGMCITCVTLPRTERLTQREIRVTVSNLLLGRCANIRTRVLTSGCVCYVPCLYMC